MSTAIPESDHTQPYRPWRRSGTWMVVIMFAFAFAMIGMMYLYWELHTRPFRPLQIAINERYPNSMPRVMGGKHKSHQPENKAKLRMIIAVDFDPTFELPRLASQSKSEEDRLTLDETMTVSPRIEQVYGSLIHLAKQTTDLTTYEEIEIFLEYRRAEKSSRTLYAVRSKALWFEKYPQDPFAKPNPPNGVPAPTPVGASPGPRVEAD